ncbi:glycosyl hydrolase family 61-domain-containing protein [Mycena amicta]|nr:glycosyl hydrolase family 61-domain-containing protein [Mycena amicta]
MKSISAFVAIATLFAGKASAHYNFPQFVAGGVTSANWQFVRQTNNWQDFNPVVDVTTTDIRCYTSLENGTASTVSVAAGSTVGFIADTNLYHPGLVNVYMAKAPTGTDVAKWDGSGVVWFRIFEVGAQTDGGTSINWPAELLTQVNFQIPAATPSGQYLIRIEHIALHVAYDFQGAQFYIGCAQVQVTGGGNGVPGPLVAFPGAYTEPSILINIYFPIPANLTNPGPPIWPAVGSGSPAPPTSSTKATTSPVASTTTVVTTSAKASSTTTSTVSTGTATPGTVQEWGQCGGTGYTGATVCVAPFACTELNPFFFQCI